MGKKGPPEDEPRLNISFRSQDWRESILSNLAPTPFSIVINGATFECGSVEGFWQGLKCVSERMRKHVFKLSGMEAKQAGRGKSTPIALSACLPFTSHPSSLRSPAYTPLSAPSADTCWGKS